MKEFIHQIPTNVNRFTSVIYCDKQGDFRQYLVLHIIGRGNVTQNYFILCGRTSPVVETYGNCQ